MEDSAAETLRADLRAGSRRKKKISSSDGDKTSSLATFLATVAPVVVCVSNIPSVATTTTWFQTQEAGREVSKKRTRADAQLAKAAAKKRKRLGRNKMKRDRLVQEIAKSQREDRNLNAKLTAINQRIAKLQSAQSQLPTA